MDPLAMHYLETARRTFTTYKTLAEKALVQVSDEGFFQTIDPESNSLALIVKHLAGNMRSRWTNYLTEDGEKPDRDRDSEFVLLDGDTRSALMQRWEEGWSLAFKGLDDVPDLQQVIQIRGQNHTILEAIERQLAHTTYHVGQILFLAKHLQSERWQNLSIPRNRK